MILLVFFPTLFTSTFSPLLTGIVRWKHWFRVLSLLFCALLLAVEGQVPSKRLYARSYWHE